MGKRGQLLKKRRLEQQAAQATLTLDDSDEDAVPTFLGGLVTPSELAVTARTLQTLTRHTELLSHTKDLKALRTAVFDFQRVSAEVSGT
ncbi:hypothetical protein JCM11251_002135, partial [Rhodosporidiobolus azoricus]